MKKEIAIAQIPNEIIPLAWPAIGPLLIAGAKNSSDIAAAIEDVAEDRARVWIILDEAGPLAAFLTSILGSGDGKALDVYGLGGKSMLRWGKRLTTEMVDYAKENGCSKVLFKGRKALMRAYDGVRKVGQEPDGTLIYERALT